MPAFVQLASGMWIAFGRQRGTLISVPFPAARDSLVN
jgi:hypothetical protein